MGIYLVYTSIYLYRFLVWLVVTPFVPVGCRDFETATIGGPFILCWAVDIRSSTAGGPFVLWDIYMNLAEGIITDGRCCLLL